MKTDFNLVLVIKKGEIWYAKNPQHNWSGLYRIDGNAVKPCLDARWTTLSCQPVIFEDLYAPPREMTGFKRLEQYKDLDLPLGLEVGKDELPLYDIILTSCAADF